MDDVVTAGEGVADFNAVLTSIENLAGSVADAAVGMVGDLVPVLAPVVGGVIVATLGFKLVRRFAK